jgi:hypothetical protein
MTQFFIYPDVSSPSSSIVGDAFEPAGTASVFESVSHVLLACGSPKITSAVVKAVTVTVIHLFKTHCRSNLPVHVNSFLLSFSVIVGAHGIPNSAVFEPAFSSTPLPLVEPFKVGIVN